MLGNWLLFIYKKRSNHELRCNLEGSRGYYVKQINSEEGQILNEITDMWKIETKQEEKTIPNYDKSLAFESKINYNGRMKGRELSDQRWQKGIEGSGAPYHKLQQYSNYLNSRTF